MKRIYGNKKVNSAILKSTMGNQQSLRQITDKTAEVLGDGVSGDIVECGVWMGGCSAAIAQTLLDRNDIRKLHLFDSFDDICEPLPIDGKKLLKQVGGREHAQGRLVPVKGFYKNRRLVGPGNEQHVENLITNVVKYPASELHIYKGWFQDTIIPSRKHIDKIAFLYLDCDLYSSIKFCLENLYDKLSPNGMIVIDDYNHYPGCRKAVNEFIKQHNIKVKLDPVGYACWRKL